VNGVILYMLLLGCLKYKIINGFYQILNSFLVLDIPVFFLSTVLSRLLSLKLKNFVQQPFCLSLFMFFLLETMNVFGQVNIASTNTFVTTSWDGWNGTDPTGFTRSGSANATTYRGTTANTIGGSYAIANSGFGYRPSTTATPLTVVGTFRNTTGSTQTSVTIEYDAFRIVTEARTPGWAVTSSLGSVSALNWTYSSTPTNTSPDIKTVTLTGLSIANNATFTVTWASDRGAGSGSSPLIGLRNVKVRFNLIASCTTPVSLSFQTQPSNVLQDAIMSPSVQVAAICSDGTVATGYTGSVTLTVNASGCGYTTQTVSFVNGVGTFSSIVFTRSPQSNLSFTATSSGLTSVVSSTFNVNAPAGAPTVTTIIQNNFDAIQDWGYSVGTPISVGSGGTTGVDVVGIVTEAGTGVLRKSYSVNNSSGDIGSRNTITFDNVTGLSTYNSVDFTFNVLSFGSGSGPGNDTGEDFTLEVSTNNGASWTTVLVQYGYSNRLFPQSSSPVTSLSLSSITYAPPTASSGPDTRSAFLLTVTGVSQFRFRFTAQNNRSEENWAIDNPKLVGTVIGSGVPFNLPTVNLGSDFQFCFGNSAQLSSTVTSVLNPTTYSWTPSAWLSSTTLPNPTISGLTTSQLYTLTITDADNCVASDQVLVSVLNSPSIIFLSPP